MEPIQGLERLRELLRQKGAAKTSETQRSSRVETTKLSNHPRISSTSLEQQLKAKILHLEQESASPQIIACVVIESVLAWEYSDRLHNEPKFSALVQHVHRHIEDEPKLKSAFAQFINQLSR